LPVTEQQSRLSNDQELPRQGHGGDLQWRASAQVSEHCQGGATQAQADSSARSLRDLSLPGNRLEALKADRSGQHSIRINDLYRVCFVWNKGDAREVEIVDYH